MNLLLRLAAGLLGAAGILVAQNIPAETALPITLNSTIDANKDKPGEKIEGRLMQDVALAAGSKIKSGSHVVGRVLEVSRAAKGGSQVMLKFDQLDGDGKIIPLNVSVRAIADSDSVYNATLPIDASSNYESETQWVTRQIGGDIVNRGRRVVASGDAIAGKWTGAVWAKLAYVPGCPPQNVPDAEQAMWVFSVNACGVYGFRDIKVVHAGDSEPLGHITLESSQDLRIGRGSGWLLIVNSAPAELHSH